MTEDNKKAKVHIFEKDNDTLAAEMVGTAPEMLGLLAEGAKAVLNKASEDYFMFLALKNGFLSAIASIEFEEPKEETEVEE